MSVTTGRSNLITVGRLTGVFGVKGWLKVKSYTDPLMNIANYSPWWLKTRHGVKPFEIDDCKAQNSGLIVHFKGVDDRDAAAEFCMIDVAVERDQLACLASGDFYWHQLIGLRVVSEFEDSICDLGTVANLLETGANDVLVVQKSDTSIDDSERLIPYVLDVYVHEVDLESGEIRVEWDPEF
ncbi:MAG: 16S rRNA processing protein RimM [Lentisphaeria bacterium]